MQLPDHLDRQAPLAIQNVRDPVPGADQSVAVKWLVDEAYSDEAASLLNGRDALMAPDLMFAEAVNALWAMRGRGDITGEDLAEAVAVPRSAPVVPAPMRQLAPSAARLALDLDHPAYDCFYLALALQEQLPVVTADRRFFNAVRKHPYLSDRIIHVENLPAA
jgi:predicted nucleic acid-binding protein